MLVACPVGDAEHPLERRVVKMAGDWWRGVEVGYEEGGLRLRFGGERGEAAGMGM